MNRYYAFLRGINISGKNKISMPDLKKGFEASGFQNVSTYLNSGNAVFSSDTEHPGVVIEEMIRKKFGLEVPVYVISEDHLKEVLSHAPAWWGNDDKNIYDNLIMILSDDTPEEISAMIGEPSADLEKIQVYEDVIFWSFDRKLYQKCRWWKKTASAGIAEKLTIRTAGTLRKMTGQK
ncbi:MAG: DUF1697 domain-containing protein [Solobacterium sp.]|nr:DUF1697 domain-containing protein [Solobacterium sp.]